MTNMEEEGEKGRRLCREDIRSLNSWSELAHETLLRSSVKEKQENERKYNSDILVLSEQIEDDFPDTEGDHNSFSKTVNEEDIDESDDDNIFFISGPSNMELSGELDYLDRNYASLPNFSSLPLDSIENDELYDRTPWSLPPDYKDLVKKKHVNVCSECNKVYTDTCTCQENKDNLGTRKSESHLKDLLKSKSPNIHMFKPKGINFQNRKHFRQSHTTPEFVQASDEGEQSDKVKNKIKSVWNNVKYGKFYSC